MVNEIFEEGKTYEIHDVVGTLTARNERAFATAEQVMAVIGIAAKELLGRKRKKDPSYEKGVEDLYKEVQRWLSN